MQIVSFEKKKDKKNIINMSSAEFAHSTVSVKGRMKNIISKFRLEEAWTSFEKKKHSSTGSYIVCP